MYTVRMPSGTFLEGTFNFSFEIANQVFSTSDASVLPGSFSFPTEVTLTPTNRRELGNPDLVTNPGTFQEYEGVWVHCYGQPLFFGTLQIRSASRTRASVTIIANPMRRLKDILLSQLDLGGEQGLGEFADWPTLMLHTAYYPEEWNFVFVPMYQSERNDYPFDFDDPDNLLRPWYNRFEVSPSLAFNAGSGALVPFPKLYYLLQQIFAADSDGFAFVNAWQTTTELQRLYLFNNWDMRTLNSAGEPDLPESINLANHVPRKVKAVELLKKVMAQWCLGLFTNVFNRSIRLVPLQDVLKRPPKHNWTAYVISENTIDAQDDAPGQFNYEQPSPERPSSVPAPEDLPVFNTLPDFQAAVAVGLADGYYYIETEHMIVQQEDAWPFDPKAAWQVHRGVVLDADRARLDTGMTSLLHRNFSELYNAPVVVSRYYETQSSSGATVWERRETDPPVALLAYRGMNDVGLAGYFPVASNHVWNPNETGDVLLDLTEFVTPFAQAERSLNWFGEYGLYETAHKTWANLLLSGKPVSLSLALPVAALTEFSMEDKVRILNMDYFVRKLRVGKPLGRGLVQVEATLLSVV